MLLNIVLTAMCNVTSDAIKFAVPKFHNYELCFGYGMVGTDLCMNYKSHIFFGSSLPN